MLGNILRFLRRKNVIRVEHIRDNISEVEEAELLNNRTIKSKYGLFLALVPPSKRIIRGKTYEYYIHLANEMIVRNNELQACLPNDMRQFALANGLYTDVTNWRRAAKTDGTLILTEPRTERSVKLKAEELIDLPQTGRKVVLHRFTESEYIRYQTALFEQSRLATQLIRAMKRSAADDRNLMKLVYVFLLFSVAVIFFLTGGINTIKFW